MPKNTPSLKIAFVIDDGLDKPDGVQQYVLTLGAWLQEKGHDVHYLSGETKRKDVPQITSLSRNLKVRFNGNSLSTPLPASPFRIKRLLDKEKFDVIHVQVPYSPFLAAQIVRFAGKKTRIIGTFHILPVGRLQHFGTKLLGYALRFNLRKFNKFLSVSEPARQFAAKTFGIKSEILPNPVNTAKFKPTAKKTGKPLNIVFLGRLVPRKGCMQLLMAVNELLKKETVPDIKLHICGAGNQKSKLEDYINSTPLKSIATMHGFVSEKEKIRFLNRADFAVFPSISGESFGIVLLEAMAAGSGVVLAGNNPGYSSVLASSSECLFDPTKPAQLADKLYALINEHAKFESIHNKQQKLVKGFDINVVGSKLLSVYGQNDS